MPMKRLAGGFHGKLHRQTFNFSFLRHTPLETLQRPFIKNKQMREEKLRSESNKFVAKNILAIPQTFKKWLNKLEALKE